MGASKKRKETRKRQFEQVRRDAKRKDAEKAAYGDFEEEGASNDTESGPTGPVSHDREDETMEDDDNNQSASDKDQDSSKKKKKKAKKDRSSEAKKTPVRFICFVGKLPFSATDETIAKHFAKVEPTAIRHATSRETGRSRGFAFVEFERFERMKDCLRLFHHSMFDDGLGGEPRRINIELTAGGGGSRSQDRKDRIRAKNKKLADERAQRTKASKEKKGKHQGSGGDGHDEKEGNQSAGRSGETAPKRHAAKKATGANSSELGKAAESAVSDHQSNGSMHPSRLARMKG